MTGPNVVLYDYPTSICSQMARLALLEKSVPFERRNIDIMKKAEQFEPWYTALNPKAVVPTLAIDDEIVTDTVRIVYRIDGDFDGPRLTPVEPENAEAMDPMAARPKRQSGWKTARHSDSLFSRLYSRFRAGLG